MDKVDELIDTLTDNILAKIKSGNSRPGEVADNTKALAELIAARSDNMK